jgi:hypothetical protein
MPIITKSFKIKKSYFKIKKDVKERFWSKVYINNGFISDEDCWLWIGAINGSGYGHMKYNEKHEYAHRLSWIFYRGLIPHGLFVLHKCDIKLCVNPSHLYLGTDKDNSKDTWDRLLSTNFSESHALHKLTNEQVSFIRETYKQDKKCLHELAIKFKVHYTNIYRIATKFHRNFDDKHSEMLLKKN